MWLVLSLLVLSGATRDLAGQEPTRIMLLGDSITSGFLGSDPVGGFRDDLYDSLMSAGGIFDLVGTQNDGAGFDADHEGHGGYFGRVYVINTEIDSYLVATDPQMVLIHLGTNNLTGGDIPLSETMLQFTELLEAHIFAYDPNMIVHLSGIIPRNDDKDSLTTELNSQLYDLVLLEQGAGYNIKYVDHNSTFKANPNWRTDYLFDAVHPNDTGYNLMALTYFDSLLTEDIFGGTSSSQPAAITDVMVDSVNSRTVLLGWTATGDSGAVGTAAWYDVRYSTSPITEGNFASATQAIGEPDPLPSGSPEEFTVGGLDPGTGYYFAVKAVGSTGLSSSISNVPFVDTMLYPERMDDFERTQLGGDWNADSTFVIVVGELSNEAIVNSWDYVSVYTPVTANEVTSLHWGSTADSAGIQGGGMALMLDAPSPDASGYLVFRHVSLNKYLLYEIINGSPGPQSLATSPGSTLPFPQAGDEFSVAVSSDIHGHHFDCYVNGVFDTRVSDTLMVQGNADTLWTGVMLHGNLNNNIEDFLVASPGAAAPPSDFSLLSPAKGDTVDTGTPMLDWEDSIDPNPSDTVSYTLYYGSSAVYAPESTVVVYGLLESAYTIPSELGDGEVVYWKVKASDTTGLETMSQQTNWFLIINIPEPPSTPPAAITDVTVDSVNSRTVLLSWTATGDSGSVGTADWYDVRYSTSPITEGNFASASQAIGEEDPLASGSPEEFTVGGLSSGSGYYFAIRAVGSTGLPSSLSNVPFADTAVYPELMDDFERVQLGGDWNADSTFVIAAGELSNESTENNWGFIAVYTPGTGNEVASLRWGSGADSVGVQGGGMALMLDAPSPDANGYLVFRHIGLNRYELYDIVSGLPGSQVIASSPGATLPFPLAGDEFSVAVSSDIHGHHFDCYINGVFDTRVTDTLKVQGNADTLWTGVMLHGNLNNNVDDFLVSGPGANLAPGAFSLLSPAKGDSVDTITPSLDWEDSVDPNAADSVLYTLYFGTSAVFAPESTVVVDSLSESAYTVPISSLMSLVGGRAHSTDITGDQRPVSPGGAAVLFSASEMVGEEVVARKGGNADEPVLSGFEHGNLIYWKVKAFDPAGLETMSQQTNWNFLVYLPIPFHNRDPEDGGTVVVGAPVLVWEAFSPQRPTKKVTYNVSYDTDPALTDAVLLSGLEDTTCVLPDLEDGAHCFWKVDALDGDGRIVGSTLITGFRVLLAVSDGSDYAGPKMNLPRAFALAQNYPNPFNPSTTIRYEIPPSGAADKVVDVLLQVYNLRGQLIRKLVDDTREPGRYQVHWNGTDERGDKAGSGVYFYSIRAGSFSAIRKMVVIE